MDNLERLHLECFEISQEFNEIEVCNVRGNVACLLTKNNTLILYETNYTKETNKSYKLDYKNNSLKYLEYLSIQNVVFCASQEDYLIFSFESNKTHVYPIIGGPITALCWNPTQTAFATINLNNNVYCVEYVGDSFKIMHEVLLDAPVPVPVVVGWGSQNTQFQGHRQKKNAEQTSTEPILNNENPVISWRGNGEQFVINYSKEGKRYLKTFSNELIPLFQSSDYFNLQHPTSFMGLGQRIACYALREDENDLVIFEKNCLIKEVYSIAEVKGTIQKLLYHPQLTVLAVMSVDALNNSFLNIYLFSNNKWFLKQQFCYDANTKLYYFDWINLEENLFTTCTLVAFTSKRIERHTLRFVINRSPIAAVTSVINGRILEFFNYDHSIIPPPMFLTSYTHSRPVNQIFFHPRKPLCVFVDSNFEVVVLSLKNIIQFDKEKKLELTILPLVKGAVSNLTTIPQFIYGTFNKENEILINFKTEDTIIGNIIKTNEEIHLAIQVDKQQNLRLLNCDSNPLMSHKVLNENSLIYSTAGVVNVHNTDRMFEFALDTFRKFYVNDSMVCNGITSVFVYKKYLLLTHESNKLYCIRLTDADLMSSNLDLTKKFVREIEQGARIVHVVNTEPPKIVLSMPRGNIETISCTLITIDIIDSLLQKNEWTKAISIARKEKLNWNVLIDLNPSRILEQVGDFVKGASKPNVLATIMNGFNLKENCFDTIYKHYSSGLPIVSFATKMNIVKEILNYLKRSMDLFKILNCIVNIDLKYNSLEAALKSIKKVYSTVPQSHLEDVEKTNFLKIKNDVCEGALKQIFAQEYYGNVIQTAYILFDFDFLNFLYYKTKEDPLIFESELKKLRQYPPIEQRFHMCLKAEHFQCAVKYLVRIDSFDSNYVKSFILKHNVVTEAFCSTKPFHKHYKLIVNLYAGKLGAQHKFIEAGFILKQAELFEEAIEMYRKALEWREVLTLITKLNWNEDQIRQFLEPLAEDLFQEKRFEEATILLEFFCENYNAAVKLLIQHKQFRKALCLAKQHNDVNAEEKIMLCFTECVDNFYEKVKLFRSRFEEYTNRLIVVRNNRKEIIMNHLHTNEEDDIFSESGSTVYSQISRGSQGTSRTLKSTLSSKNRRKEEKKKISLKPGNYYEDIALIRVLHHLYTEVFDFGNDVREVCLVEQNDLKPCQNLHIALKQLQDDMLEKIPEIWLDVFVNPVSTTDPAILAVIQNRNDIDPKYATPPNELNQSWILSIFL